MKSLSGSFRTTTREQRAMVQCRAKLRMSVNQIAVLMRRSSATVHKYVKGVGCDNRRLSPSIRSHQAYQFTRIVKQLRLRVKMYLAGITEFAEAITCKMIPLTTIDWFLESENYLEDDGEDPA